MSDSGITIADRAALIDSNIPPFVGRPVIYYSFLDALPDLRSTYEGKVSDWSQYFRMDAATGVPYYSSFNDAANTRAKECVKEIFDLLGSMLNVQFQVATDTQAPDIRFGGITDQSLRPAGGVNFRNGSLNDIYIARSITSFNLGDYGYQVLIHEIGHALGLKHTDEGTPVLSGSLDSHQIAVMSNTESPTGSATFGSAGYGITLKSPRISEPVRSRGWGTV